MRRLINKKSQFFLKTIFFIVFILLSFFVFSKKNQAAVDIVDKDTYLGDVEEGWNISCLSSSPSQGYDTSHIPSDKIVKVDLSGQCQGSEGCYLVICQGINEQYYEDQERLEECSKHSKDEPLPEYNTWEGERTWGAWCEYVQEQMGNTFESEIGCRSGVPKLDAVLPNSSDPHIPTFSLNKSSGEYHLAKGSISGVTVTLHNAYDHIPYQFYAFGRLKSSSQPSPNISASISSQQIGQINFTDFENTSNISKCVTITWDPYGRVFDSKSLEPIPNVLVKLLDKDKNPAKQITKNYDVTLTNGLFNIQVEKEDYYYLTVNSPSTHEFTSSPDLNPNYKYVYSDIYYPGKSFFEKAGVPTHHDIPLKPKSTPYYGNIVIYEESLNQMDLGEVIKISGKVSHPLARICIFGENTKKNYGCVQADKSGFFQIFVNKNNYSQEAFIFKTYKFNPNNISQFIDQRLKVEDNTTKEKEKILKMEPLLRYVEGYLYDENGQILTNTKVLVKLKKDNKIIFQTISDKNGFIKIKANNLPMFDYYLEIVLDSNKKITQQTSAFVKKNEDYLKKENINLIYKQKPTEKINQNNNYLNNNKVNFKDNKTELTNEKTSVVNNKIIAIVLILFILIIAVFGIIYFYLKNKKL